MPRSNRNPARSGDVDTNKLLEELVGLQKRTNKLLAKLLETMEPVEVEEDSEIAPPDDSFAALPQRPLPETPRPEGTRPPQTSYKAPVVPPTGKKN